MKKRLLVLLLAGLLSAAVLTSCEEEGERESESWSIETSSSEVSTEPTPSNYEPTDETVYATDRVTLRESDSISSKSLGQVPAGTKLTCSEKNNLWSKVTYVTASETITGYIKNAYLTRDDLLGETFTQVAGGFKTMYSTTDGLNVRLYASSAEFSTVKGHYQKGDAVKVLAVSENWCKVSFTGEDQLTHDYFVSAKYLSDTKPTDGSFDPSSFTDITPVVKYTTGNVKLRSTPILDDKNENVAAILEKGEAVTVTKTGTVDGTYWSYVEYTKKSAIEGGAPTHIKGYIAGSANLTTETTAKKTLDEVLAQYPGSFTKLENSVTYYVSTDAAKVRKTPSLDGNNEYKFLQKKDAVTAVASGTYGGNNWFILSMDDSFYFIGSSVLTTDPDGEPVLNKNEIPTKYPEYDLLNPEEQATVTTRQAPCYATPDSTSNPAQTLAQGATVAVVAKQVRGEHQDWWIIRTEGGTLYFVWNGCFAESVG